MPIKLTGRKLDYAESEKDDAVCMSCGCGKPNDNHGDERNITEDDLDRAAQAANIGRDQAAQNIMDCCGQVAAEQGAPGQASAAPSASA